jgi:ribosome biogenesis GTPase
VEALFFHCRFSDCRHQTEPGCAVIAALKDGSLSPERWERYLGQQRENRFVNGKAAYLAEKRARGKDIAMWSKEMQKKGKIK